MMRATNSLQNYTSEEVEIVIEVTLQVHNEPSVPSQGRRNGSISNGVPNLEANTYNNNNYK